MSKKRSCFLLSKIIHIFVSSQNHKEGGLFGLLEKHFNVLSTLKKSIKLKLFTVMVSHPLQQVSKIRVNAFWGSVIMNLCPFLLYLTTEFWRALASTIRFALLLIVCTPNTCILIRFSACCYESCPINENVLKCLGAYQKPFPKA